MSAEFPGYDLVFVNSPKVEFATNTFVNVPTILQYDSEPIVQMVYEEKAGYTTDFRIYNADGVKLAAVRGSRLFLTDDGAKSNLTLSHPDKMTVCKLGDQVLFEIHRKEAAALKTEAELYTPDGSFIRCRGGVEGYIKAANGPLQIGGLTMINNTFVGCRIGVHVKSDGSFAIGVG